mgnify:CR=1 FL=1|jgi:DNA-binding cell septation regulator SpoVG
MGSVATKFAEPTVDGGTGDRVSKTGGTNWVVDDFTIIQENGGNIITENDKYIALAEFKDVVWTTSETTGNG